MHALVRAVLNSRDAEAYLEVAYSTPHTSVPASVVASDLLVVAHSLVHVSTIHVERLVRREAFARTPDNKLDGNPFNFGRR